MKRQLLVLVALLMAASTASAQQKARTFSLTPKVGVTVSGFTGRMPVYVAYAVMPQITENEGSFYIPDSDPGTWGLISYDNKKRKEQSMAPRASMERPKVSSLTLKTI